MRGRREINDAMTKAQAVAKALKQYDEICVDSERRWWTDMLKLEEDGGEIQYENVDAILQQQRVRQAAQREAIRRMIEQEYDKWD